MTKLFDKSIEELHSLLVSKEISATDLTKATFDRIKETEDQVDAFITLSEEQALNVAKALDLKGISEDNALAGIPIGIKDNIVTKDILTTAASKILYNFEPIYDATVMDKVYQADLIPVGKLNMDEFAMGGSTETSYFKKTKNAWDGTKVPGGSSGGSAASVAAGQIPVSLGSDTGGSIRQPASFNGIVGMKDGTSSGISVPDFAEGLTGDIKGMKIALPKEYLGEGVQSGVKEAILKAADTYRALGATVEEVSLPHSKYGVAVYYIIASSEASSNLQRFDGIRYGYRSENVKDLEDVYVNSRSEGFGDEVKRRIMLGTFSLSAGYYDAYFKKAGQVRTLIREDFAKVFENYDLIIGPSSPTVAFGLGENINDPITMYMSDILTIPVNLAGLPGMSIPAGFSEGLPVGLQIIGKAFDEQTMYKAAYAFEQATDFHTKKPVILGGKD